MSGFSRMVHVLKTTTSAWSADVASPSPSDSSMPLIRSESWAFIWQPKVVTWYRLTASIVARRVARSSGRRLAMLLVALEAGRGLPAARYPAEGPRNAPPCAVHRAFPCAPPIGRTNDEAAVEGRPAASSESGFMER